MTYKIMRACTSKNATIIQGYTNNSNDDSFTPWVLLYIMTYKIMRAKEGKTFTIIDSSTIYGTSTCSTVVINTTYDNTC